MRRLLRRRSEPRSCMPLCCRPRHKPRLFPWPSTWNSRWWN